MIGQVNVVLYAKQRHKVMETRAPQKCIDDIKDKEEIYALCRILGIDDNGDDITIRHLKNLLKQKIQEQSQNEKTVKQLFVNLTSPY